MRPILRLPLKWLTFGVVTLFVLFPDPRVVPRVARRYAKLDDMIDPRHPRLVALRQELESEAGPALADTAKRRFAVQKFVYSHVAYAWDWDEWGAAEYLPTLDEMFRAADARPDRRLREDCDGRAVVAASLLAALGETCHIVTDLRHVWVESPHGGLMGPGHAPALRGAPGGSRASGWNAIANLPRGFAYGVAVFPLLRELVLWIAAIALSYHRRMPPRTSIVLSLLPLAGLLTIRSRGGAALGTPPGALQSWLGCGAIVVGLCGLWMLSYRLRRPLPIPKERE